MEQCEDGLYVKHEDAQRALDAEQEKVAKLEAALDAAQGESTRWFRAARLQREAGRDLRALARALIYSDNAPEHVRAWFALRATLDATTPAGRQE